MAATLHGQHDGNERSLPRPPGDLNQSRVFEPHQSQTGGISLDREDLQRLPGEFERLALRHAVSPPQGHRHLKGFARQGGGLTQPAEGHRSLQEQRRPWGIDECAGDLAEL